MLEVISKILLGYYVIVAVALLVFLAWAYVDDRRQAAWSGRANRNGDALPPRPGTGPDRALDPPPDTDAHRPENGVEFSHDN
jgi:hypothetical protein